MMRLAVLRAPYWIIAAASVMFAMFLLGWCAGQRRSDDPARLDPAVVTAVDSLRATAPAADTTRVRTVEAADSLTRSSAVRRANALRIATKYTGKGELIGPTQSSVDTAALYRAAVEARDSLAIALTDALAAARDDSAATAALRRQVFLDTDRLRAYAATLDRLQRDAERVARRHWYDRCGIGIGAGISRTRYAVDAQVTLGCVVVPIGRG